MRMGSSIIRRSWRCSLCIADRHPQRAILALTISTVLVLLLLPASALAGDTPSGFYYGADGNGPTGAGSGYPYAEPGTGGIYGGYVGEVGTWTNWQQCTSGRALNDPAISQANADEAWYGWGIPIPGVAFYWFAAGPGADPNYNGTYSEAYDWGAAQAERALWAYHNTLGGYVTDSTWPFMFMDIERQNLNGYNGWDEFVDSCGNVTSWNAIPYNVDRGTVDGFIDNIAGTGFWGGIYSAPAMWNFTFGTGSDGSIPYYYQWTYETSTDAVTPDPVAFCQSGYGCAQWFGGVASGYEIGWQWNQNGGDWDQWDVNNFP